MLLNAYKLHTNTFARLVGVIQKSMFGINRTTFNQYLPRELYNVKEGDMVFVSEFEVNNVLFGPFYVVRNRVGIVGSNHGLWVEIDHEQSDQHELAYWVTSDRYNYCLLFEKLLAKNFSIVQPYHWNELNVHLPSWGKIEQAAAEKLVEFSLQTNHQVEAREFLRKHGVL